jgi:hypothetical protein
VLQLKDLGGRERNWVGWEDLEGVRIEGEASMGRVGEAGRNLALRSSVQANTKENSTEVHHVSIYLFAIIRTGA